MKIKTDKAQELAANVAELEKIANVSFHYEDFIFGVILASIGWIFILMVTYH